MVFTLCVEWNACNSRIWYEPKWNTCAMCAHQNTVEWLSRNCSVMFFLPETVFICLEIHSKGEMWVKILLTTAFVIPQLLNKAFAHLNGNTHDMAFTIEYVSIEDYVKCTNCTMLSYLNKINRHTQLKSNCVGLGSKCSQYLIYVIFIHDMTVGAGGHLICYFFFVCKICLFVRLWYRSIMNGKQYSRNEWNHEF